MNQEDDFERDEEGRIAKFTTINKGNRIVQWGVIYGVDDYVEYFERIGPAYVDSRDIHDPRFEEDEEWEERMIFTEKNILSESVLRTKSGKVGIRITVSKKKDGRYIVETYGRGVGENYKQTQSSGKDLIDEYRSFWEPGTTKYKYLVKKYGKKETDVVESDETMHSTPGEELGRETEFTPSGQAVIGEINVQKVDRCPKPKRRPRNTGNPNVGQAEIDFDSEPSHLPKN